MNTPSRRAFVKLVGAAAAIAGAPRIARAQTAPAPVVVVGGGFAGATAAKYLRLWSTLNVTLVDSSSAHISCILSNLILNGQRTLGSITFPLSTLRRRYGVRTVTAKVSGIDRGARRVLLSNGSSLAYERLILAPGISFQTPNAYDMSLVPHAWIAGPQTTILRNQLLAMPASGTFILTVPKAPYRCPPGPYERACVVADLLKRRAGSGPRPRVIVLDANPKIMAEEHTFTQAFNVIHRGIIEYHPSANGDDYSVTHVNADLRTVETPSGVFTGDVVNVIPTHQASQLVVDAGLTDASGFAPVSPLTYVSLDPHVHVIGDAQSTPPQPKSGHMANSQAKYCADAVIRSLVGGENVEANAERAANIVTNSACFSPITARTAGWLNAAYRYDPANRAMKLISEAFAEAPSITGDNYQTMFDWANNLFADTFR